MPIVLVEDVNRPLTVEEFDGNFTTLKAMIDYLTDHPLQGVGVSSITQDGTAGPITFHMSDGTTRGPFTLPKSNFRYRGDWAALTSYVVGDFFAITTVGLYVALQTHISDTAFDPDRQIGGDDVYALAVPFAFGIPSGGFDRFHLVKQTDEDYDVAWVPPLLEDMFDVEMGTAGPANGQFLQWNTLADRWIPATAHQIPPGGFDRYHLVKQTDADYDAAWVPPLLEDLFDVEMTTAGPQDGQLLGWVNSMNRWTPVNVYGLPAAGSSGQSLRKTSGANYAADWSFPVEALQMALSDETTVIEVGIAKITFRMPYKGQFVGLPRANINTVSSSGLPTVDINKAGVTILSTKLSIDVSEKTSVTAAVPAVVSVSTFNDDDEFTMDIDVAGTGATGLKVTLYIQQVP